MSDAGPTDPPPQTRTVGIRLPTLVTAAAVAFLSAVNLIWLQRHTAPPSWDPSNYLETTELLFQATGSHSASAFIQAYLTAVFGSKAPLISLTPLPAFFLLGNTKTALDLTLAAMVACFGWVCYRMCTLLTGDRWLAAAATVITSTMPIIYGLSRVFLVEYDLTILVMAWLWIQLRSENFRRIEFSPLLALIFGLGMLMKVTFAGFVVIPAVWGVARHVREHGLNAGTIRRIGLSWLVIAGLGGALLGTWYLPNGNYLATVNHALAAAGSQDYNSYASYGTLAASFPYSRDMVLFGMSTAYGVLGLALVLVHVARRFAGGAKRPDTSRPFDAAVLLVVWPAVMFGVSCFAVVKDLRYLLPIFPAIGAGLAWLLVSAFQSAGARTRAWAVPALLLGPVLVFLLNTLPFSDRVAWSPGGWFVFGPSSGYIARPVEEQWPNEAIIQRIARDAPRFINGPAAKAPLVLAIFDLPYFNQHTLRYQTTHLGLNDRMHWSAMQTGQGDSDGDVQDRLAWMQQAKYLITKSKEQGVQWLTFHNRDILRLLESGALPYTAIETFDLPDGSQATLYRHNREDVSVVDLTQAVTRHSSIVAWEAQLAAPDILRLKVWREIGDRLVVVAQSERTPGVSGHNVFALKNPIEVSPGDFIGLYAANGKVRGISGDDMFRRQYAFPGDIGGGDVKTALIVPQQYDMRLGFSDGRAVKKQAPLSAAEMASVAITFGDFSKRLTVDGALSEWVINSLADHVARLKIWRQYGDQWTVVAEGPLERAQEGANRFFLDPPISVQAGDMVGFSTSWPPKNRAGADVPFPIAWENCGNSTGSGYAPKDFRGQPAGLVADPHCFQVHAFLDDARFDPTASTVRNPPSAAEVSSVSITFGDFSKRIADDGLVTGWVVNSLTEHIARLNIWRQTKDGWMVVAEGPFEKAAEGRNRFALDPPIRVRAGDVIGFATNWPPRNRAGASVPFPVAWESCGTAKGSWYTSKDFRGELPPESAIADSHCFQVHPFAGDGKSQ